MLAKGNLVSSLSDGEWPVSGNSKVHKTMYYALEISPSNRLLVHT